MINRSVCQSNLKQQCQDTDGLYDWIRKDFKLLVDQGLLEIKDLETESQLTVSVNGAKYAKEWSYSSSLAGYGFDIVWVSGKIWSFLVDNEDLCKNWVCSLNDSISLLNKNEKPIQTDVSKVPQINTDDLQDLRRSNKTNNSLQNLNESFTFDNGDITRVNVFTPITTKSDPQRQQHTMDTMRYPSQQNHSHNHDLSAQQQYQDTRQLKPVLYPTSTAPQSVLLNDTTSMSIGEISLIHHGGSVPNPSMSGSPISNSSSSSTIRNDTHSQSVKPPLVTGNNKYATTEKQQHREFGYSSTNHFQPMSHDNIDSSQFAVTHPASLYPPPSPSPPVVAPVITVERSEPSLRDTASAIESELHGNLLRERSKCQQLERQLERRGLEADLAAKQIDNLQEELLLRVAELQRHLEVSKEKERAAEQFSKSDVETRVTRACNDNNGFYEASLKAAKIQHQRELTCLREELLAERKRHSALLEKEIALRSHAERSEQQLRSDLNGLQDQLAGLQIEFARCRDTHQSDCKSWDRERLQLISECESRISSRAREKVEIQTHSRQELQNKVSEMKQRHESALREATSSRQEALREELQSELVRQGNDVQKRCQRDIEAVRTEERKLAAIELTNLRAAFTQREHNTSEDLLQLERLHATRVGQLEQQISVLKSNGERLTEALHAASLRVDRGSENSEHKALQFRQQMEEHSKRAEQLHRQLEAFETELHQSRSRETSYRNQLARALEETRIKSAELIEARQQASSGSVQAQQWRKVSQESDLSIAAAQSTVQIAREEVAMLEFELRRAQDESAALRQELLRADKLIFGVAQHQREPNAVDREIENAVPRNVTTTKSGSGRFPAAQHHSSVIYATPNKELSNNKHKKDIQSAVRPSVKAASGKSVSNVAVVTAPSPFAYRTVLSHRTRDWHEWMLVKDCLYSDDLPQKIRGIEIVAMWRGRGRVPHSADSTAQLIEAELNSMNWRSEMEMKLMYSMTIIRAVNGLVDANQQGYFADSVLNLAERLGLPGWIVELRHDATHNQLPSFSVLKAAARHLLDWYFNFYWQPQFVLLQTLDNLCNPTQEQPSSSSVTAPNGETISVPLMTFDSHLIDASPSFISELFIPVFISSNIMTPFKICHGMTLQHGALGKEMTKQKRQWLPRIVDILNKFVVFLHPLLCRILLTATELAISCVNSSENIDQRTVEWNIDLATFWADELMQYVANNITVSTRVRPSGKHAKGKKADNRSEIALQNEFSDQCVAYMPFIETVAGRLVTWQQKAGNNDAVAKACALTDKCYSFYQRCMLKSTLSGESTRNDESADIEEEETTAGDLDEMEAYLRTLEAQTDTPIPANKKAKIEQNEQQTVISSVKSSDVKFLSVSDSVPLVTYQQLIQPPTLRTSRGGIRRCPDYPVWPLGCLPGQSGSGHLLYSLSEIDPTLIVN